MGQTNLEWTTYIVNRLLCLKIYSNVQPDDFFFLCVCRYPGTTFMDHVIRYHDDPNVKMIVVLGEVQL